MPTQQKQLKLSNPIEKHFVEVSKYHILVWSLLFIAKFPIGWHLLNILFISPPMEFTCDGEKNRCPCPRPVWNRSVFSETVQTKFDLSCSSSWIESFSASTYYSGLMVGAFIFGIMSDRYGRLFTFSITCITLGVFGCISAVVPSIYGFVIMRFTEGIGLGGAIVTGYVLCIEYSGVTHRETITALYHIPINFAHMTLAGVSYFLRNMDHYMLAISVPVLICSLLYFCICESPKWLMDNGNVEKSARTMTKICKFNKKPCDNIEEELIAYHTAHSTKDEEKMYFWHLFHHKGLTLNFVCMAFIYFICGIGYYGVSQFIGQMSGNIHLNVCISGAILIPGTLSSIFLLKLFGRRTLLMATSFLSGTSMIVVVSVSDDLNYVRLGFACVCNMFYFMSFIIVFLYGVELFPTVIRNSVLGLLSLLSRVGQMSGPLVNQLPQIVSGSIFVSLAILAAGLCYFLPETKNTELPSTIQDTETLTKKRKHLEIVTDNSTDAATSKA